MRQRRSTSPDQNDLTFRPRQLVAGSFVLVIHHIALHNSESLKNLCDRMREDPFGGLGIPNTIIAIR